MLYISKFYQNTISVAVMDTDDGIEEIAKLDRLSRLCKEGLKIWGFEEQNTGGFRLYSVSYSGVNKSPKYLNEIDEILSTYDSFVPLAYDIRTMSSSPKGYIYKDIILSVAGSTIIWKEKEE